VVLHRLGETEEAEALYRRWLAAHPDDVATRLDLYRLLGARGAFDEALSLLREVEPGAQRSADLDCAEGRLLAWWMDRRDEARPPLRACRQKGGELTPQEVRLLDGSSPSREVQRLDGSSPSREVQRLDGSSPPREVQRLDGSSPPREVQRLDGSSPPRG
jgi:hypothetical protein